MTSSSSSSHDVSHDDSNSDSGSDSGSGVSIKCSSIHINIFITSLHHHHHHDHHHIHHHHHHHSNPSLGPAVRAVEELQSVITHTNFSYPTTPNHNTIRL